MFGGLAPDGGAPVETAVGFVGADGAVVSWAQGPQLPAPVFDFATVSASSSVYMLGGFTTIPTDVVRFSRRVAGVMTPWVPTVSLLSPRSGACAAAVAGFVFVVGGHATSDPATPTTDVSSSKINADASLAGWTPSLPYPIAIRAAGCAAF